MKKLLFLPFLFSSYIGIGQGSDPAFIIGKTVELGKLLIAQNNFKHPMNWDDANKVCARLGKGWRLPTKEELNILYQNKYKIGNFYSQYYWSSTHNTEVNSNSAFYIYFVSGEQGYRNTSQDLYVRAVYENTTSPLQSKNNTDSDMQPVNNTDYKNIIGMSIKIGNLEIAQFNFPNDLNWDDASKACTKLGKGWRLPTKEELIIFVENKNKIEGIAKSVWWSSTVDKEYDFAWCLGFEYGPNYLNGFKKVENLISKSRFATVHAVRTYYDNSISPLKSENKNTFNESRIKICSFLDNNDVISIRDYFEPKTFSDFNSTYMSLKQKREASSLLKNGQIVDQSTNEKMISGNGYQIHFVLKKEKWVIKLWDVFSAD